MVETETRCSSGFCRKSSAATRTKPVQLQRTRTCRSGLVSAPELLHAQLCQVWRPAAPRTLQPELLGAFPPEEDAMWARRGPPLACHPPSSAGRGHISVGLRALVNIIGSWCVKLTVPVRSPRATAPTRPSRAALLRGDGRQEGDTRHSSMGEGQLFKNQHEIP